MFGFDMYILLRIFSKHTFKTFVAKISSKSLTNDII